MGSVPMIRQSVNYRNLFYKTLLPVKKATDVGDCTLSIVCHGETITIDLLDNNNTSILSEFPNLVNLFKVIKDNVLKDYNPGNELFKFHWEKEKIRQIAINPANAMDSRGMKRSLGITQNFAEKSTTDIASIREQLSEWDDYNNDIFNSITHTEQLGNDFIFANKENYVTAAKDPINIEELIRRIIFTLYQEPQIVRTFFSTYDENILTDFSKLHANTEIFDAKGILKAKDNIRLVFYRDGADISKNREHVNNLYQKKVEGNEITDAEMPALKSEGIYAYLNENVSSEKFSNNDYTIGYIPFVLTGNVFDSLSRRKVSITYKNALSTGVNYFEHGWIFPQAMNITKEKTLFDNKLLFHWIGESLGVGMNLADEPANTKSSSVIPEFELDKIVQNFIKENIYSKDVDLSDDIQIPLKAGKKYRFALVPLNFIGGIPLVHKDDNLDILKQHLISNDLLSAETEFIVLDPLNPPEIISESPSKVEDEETDLQIIIKNPVTGRFTTVEKKFRLLPPRVEFNVAKWLATFEIHTEDGEADINEICDWIERLNNKEPDSWYFSSSNDLPYVFDKRVLDAQIEAQTDSSDVIKFSHLPSGKKSMKEVSAVLLTINSVPVSKKEELKLEKDKVVLYLPHGRETRLKLGYNLSGSPSRKIKIINAVAKYEDGDGKVELKKTTTTFFARKTSTENSISLLLEKLNKDVAGYFYIFRRYIRVNPNEHKELPPSYQVLYNRMQPIPSINANLINEETDRALFNNISGNAQLQEEVAKFTENKIHQLFDASNVFHLSEIFGEVKVEMVTLRGTNEKEIKDSKYHIDPEKVVNGSFPVNIIIKEDQRAKKIDYINVKLYSRHIQFYKKEVSDTESLLKNFDYNINSILTEPELIHHGEYNAAPILDTIPPPKFNTKLLFLNDTQTQNDSNKRTKKINRRAFLLITFEREELNVLSDNDYIGVDFSAHKQKIATAEVRSNRTDLGVDFTINTTRTRAISEADVKIALKLDANYKLTHNFSNQDELGEVFVRDKIAYVKPLFLYNEDKGFFLWDVSTFLNGSEMDPFLKISLCRAYPTDQKLTSFIRTASSSPVFIQLSSSKSLEIITDSAAITIKKNSKTEQKKMRSHYIFCFCSDKTSFAEPLKLARLNENETIESWSYFSLTTDSSLNLVTQNANQFTIKITDKNIRAYESYENINKETIQTKPGFNLVGKSFQLFEFYTYDNEGLVTDGIEEINGKIDALISTPGFNPFNNSNFRMVFKSVVDL